ncbi:MAG: very short patch repair endonuclease [Chloroflexi bacterium]|nr:very short patch repair endonuclease [Chloroflexota bacterium]
MAPDVVDAPTRSRMMSGIRGRDTKPEMVIRKGLHARGYRYRLHSRSLPGKPDLVFPSRRAAIFVHGCFWHGHDCPLFKWPSTRAGWWREKIEGNRARDQAVRQQLAAMGWRQLRIWECALKGRQRRPVGELLDSVGDWLEGVEPDQDERGT